MITDSLYAILYTYGWAAVEMTNYYRMSLADGPDSRSFNVDTGEEDISIYVNDRSMHMFEMALQKEDAKGVLIYYACCWLGRSADEYRCKALAVRLDEQTNRIELRLRFDPPWYWEKVRERLQTAGEETAEPGTVCTV